MNVAEALGLRPHPFRILTLDGGGVRGILPLIWIQRLEQLLKSAIGANVELIAGTSVGAIIGCALGAGRSAEEIHGLWVGSAHMAFAKPMGMGDHLRRLAHMGGMAPKYLDVGLVTMLKSVFGDMTMGELQRPTLAIAYCPKSMSVHVFSSLAEEHQDLPVWECCRASAAAPFFFSPHNIVTGPNGEKVPLIDGGVTANNPVVVAVAEAFRGTVEPRARSVKDVLVASFGTGEVAGPTQQAPRTIFGHQSMLLRALVRGASHTAEYATEVMLPAANYWRFQVNLPASLASLDAADNVDELIGVAHQYLANGADRRLQALARRMQGKRPRPTWRDQSLRRLGT